MPVLLGALNHGYGEDDGVGAVGRHAVAPHCGVAWVLRRYGVHLGAPEECGDVR